LLRRSRLPTLTGMETRNCTEGPKADWALRGWDVWAVDCYPGVLKWSARPIGARVAVIIGMSDLETLEEKITEYESDIDEHVRTARVVLDALGEEGPYTAREVQACLIVALAELKARQTADR
jgi:hypothetical protein